MSDSTSAHVQQEQGESSADALAQKQQELPGTIHPDDAKDKVFTAILKALLKLGNKPSSPKELANVIMKYKYATLGGATPFATVSSRISQHFKRAAEHNPPRPPLLARHFDEHHSRKINYSLATEPTSTQPGQEPPSPPLSQPLPAKPPAVQKRQSARRRQTTTKAAETTMLSDTSPLSSEDESVLAGTSTSQRRSRHAPVTRSSRRRTRRKRQQLSDSEEEDNDYPTRVQEADDEQEVSATKRAAKRLRTQRNLPPGSLPLSPVTGPSSSSSLSSYSPPSTSSISGNDKPKPQFEDLNSPMGVDAEFATSSPMDVNMSDAESEADYSDYHEEMLKGDEVLADIDFNTTHAASRRRSSVAAVTTRRPSIAQATASDMQRSNSANASLYSTQDSPRLSSRRQSFSMNGGFLGEELWNTNGNYEQDFDTVFLSDESTAHQIPFHIATPESISISELDQYFNGDNNGNNKSSKNNGSNNNNSSSASSSSSQFLSPNVGNGLSSMPESAAARTISRKSFCALPGSRETSLLQRALLASTARGMAAAAAAAAESSAGSTDDNVSEEQQADVSEEAEDILSRPRRKSWPGDRCSSGIDLLEEENEKPANVEIEDTTDPQQSLNNDKVIKESDEQTKNEETEQDDKLVKTTPVPVEHYRIIKKTFGALECYQLDSPNDIPDTKILRFISSTDGATEHVALRTRHAADANRDRRNSQHFYLDEGYVNATQLRKAARPILGKGSFDASAETDDGKVVVSLTKGPTECRGAWVPLTRARELAEEFKIASFPGVQKLLSDDPLEMSEEQDKSESESNNTSNEDKQQKKQTDQQKQQEQQEQTAPANSTRKQSTQMNLNVDEDDGESYMKFEDDEDHKKTTKETRTNIVTNVDSLVPEIKVENKPETEGSSSAASDFFKSFGLQGINMSALQQLSSVIPNLSQFSNPLELAKALSSYMQSLVRLPQPSSSSALSSSSTATTSSDSQLNDFKSLLARLPDDLANASQSPSTASTPVLPTVNIDSEQPIVHTSLPTNPTMYITILDNTAVCVAVLPAVDAKPEYRIMRRLDSGYINGTELLTAGGIDTESERSMILSFELERVRVPKKTSPLYGTWIPLRRAQELAVTCSLQHRLGPFLNESIDKFFPSPLPITVPVNRRQIKHDRLPALNLPGLRNTTRNVMPSPIARSLSPPTPTATAAQLHHLLITNNRRAPECTLKAPLLGNFDESDDDGRERTIAVIDCPATPTSSSFSTKGKDAKSLGHKRNRSTTDDGSDVDVVNSASEEDDDTDTDNDVEEVRKRMKKMRDAAIDAMGNGSLLDLEDLLRRASTPIMENPRRPSFSNRSQRNGNEPRRNAAGKIIARRRPQGGSGGGKIAPSAIKKSASWSGALASPLRVVVPTKKLQTAKKQSANSRPSKPRSNKEDDVGVNRVVEHKSSSSQVTSNALHVSTPAVSVKSEPKTDVLATIHEDDEDEEIDIGGSDRDDDLR